MTIHVETPASGTEHSLTVIVPIFGDMQKWMPLAQRAVYSVQNQTLKPEALYLSQGDSLAHARNRLIFDGTVTTERLLFLDADDELDPGFVEAIDKVQGDLIQPSLSVDGGKPTLLTPRDITLMNYLIIGTAMNTEMFVSVGGFDEELEALEDWDVFGKMIIGLDATVTPCPEAVYLAHSRPGSRNRGPEARSLVPVVQERLRNLRLRGEAA